MKVEKLKKGKRKKRVKELVVLPSYGITTNDSILRVIDHYCKDRGKTADEKAEMEIFTSLIYSRIIKYGKRQVQIPRSFFIKTFGQSRYFKVKSDCLSCTVTIERNYSARLGTCAVYGIKKELLGDIPGTYYPNCSDKLQRSLIRRKVRMDNAAQRFDRFYNDSRVELQNRFLDEIKPKLTKERAEQTLSELLKSGVISKATFYKQSGYFEAFENGYHRVSVPDLNGRLYSVFSYIKKECRNLIGSDYVEVDIRNSQPFILGRLLVTALQRVELPVLFVNGNQSYEYRFRRKKQVRYAESYKNSQAVYIDLYGIFRGEVLPHNNVNNNKCIICVSDCCSCLTAELEEEIIRFATIADKGIFYEEVVKWAEDLPLKFKPLLHLIRDVVPLHKSYSESEITPEQKKAIAKKCFLYWVNGKSSFKRRKFIAYKFYEQVFPNIARLLAALKEKHGYTAIHSLITKVESNLVFKVVHEISKSTEGSVIAGTVHDAFYVKKDYVELLLDTLREEAAQLHSRTDEKLINGVVIAYKERRIKE